MSALVAYDTGSVLAFVVKDPAGVLVPDIVSALLRWRVDKGPITESTMEVDEDNSRVSYQFQDDELQPGTLRAEVVITDSGGDELTSREPTEIQVRDRL